MNYQDKNTLINLFPLVDEAPSYATVKRWYNELNRGHHSLTDEFRKDRPKSVVGPENINAVQKPIMQDRHVRYSEIEATLDISSTSIYKILHEHLAVKMICSRWISHNLTKAQKDARVDWCKQMLKKCSNACESIWIIKENTLKNNKAIFDDKLLFFIIRLKI